METKQEMMATFVISGNIFAILHTVFLLGGIPISIGPVIEFISMMVCPILTLVELVRRKMSKPSIKLVKTFAVVLNIIVILINMIYMVSIFGVRIVLCFGLFPVIISSLNLYALFWLKKENFKESKEVQDLEEKLRKVEDRYKKLTGG